jgi:mono/diheme cytochrome c family protein
MKAFKLALFAALCATPALFTFGAQKSKKPANVDRVARGKYLVTFGGCNDCHTPLIAQTRPGVHHDA